MKLAASSHFRASAIFLLLLNAAVLGISAQAQTIRIKLVNGRNGHPVAHACVNVGVDHLEEKHMLAIPTNEDGVAEFRFTDTDAELNTKNPWQRCGDFGVIRPVLKYSERIGINSGYVLCGSRTSDYSWLAVTTFSTPEVLQRGVVTPNTCGNATASPEAGEILIFVRPLTWWEKLKA